MVTGRGPSNQLNCPFEVRHSPQPSARVSGLSRRHSPRHGAWLALRPPGCPEPSKYRASQPSSPPSRHDCTLFVRLRSRMSTRADSTPARRVVLEYEPAPTAPGAGVWPRGGLSIAGRGLLSYAWISLYLYMCNYNRRSSLRPGRG